MPEPLPISVLLLARDEARELGTLLPALAFAAEVVVVCDPRGTLATRDTAVRLGARVCEHAFAGFGAQRRFALAQCRQPWVLWIDADERPDVGLVAALRAALAPGGAAGPGVAGLRIVRRTWFLGRRIRFCGWQDERIVRAFRRESASFDDAPVHERVTVTGAIADLAGTIEHRSYETVEACVTKMQRYARAGAEAAHARGRRAGVLDLLLRPPLRFARQYLLQLGVLDGAHGLVLCGFAAAQVFLKYATLWDLGRRRGKDAAP
jgi:glycosyltransferase involved in cell wall biosynthesis